MSEENLKREFSQDQRDKLADSGAALPDGSFPIVSRQDLMNAIHAYGRANPEDRAKVRRHIMKRARALGLTDLIPDDWKSGDSDGKSVEIAHLESVMVCDGGAIKLLGDGRIGGRGVTFRGKDLEDDYFDVDTYYGARGGDGADCLFHHGIPVKKSLEGLSDHLFAPVKVTRDELGLFVETVLDMSDEYERKVAELVKTGKLGWSSGASSHMVRRDTDGKITRWPIIEFSMTPTPAEPRNRIASLKSWLEESEDEYFGTALKASSIHTERDFERFLRDSGYPSKLAVAITNHGFKSALQRESEEDQRDAETQAAQEQNEKFFKALELQHDTGNLYHEHPSDSWTAGDGSPQQALKTV